MESIEAANRCSLQETSTTHFATRKLNAFEFMWKYAILFKYYFLFIIFSNPIAEITWPSRPASFRFPP